MSSAPLAGALAEEVWELLAARVGAGERRFVAIDRAVGRVLADDARAPSAFPPFDRAVMDGYAVRCEDFAAGRAVLRCDGLARAGAGLGLAVERGACLRINTGAPLPAGADAVVMVEHARELDSGAVELEGPPTPGQHIERHGSLLQPGALIAPAGTLIRAGAVAALAAAGLRAARVFAPPRVALISTGDELAPVDRDLGPGEIYDSNRIALTELSRAAGGEVMLSETAPDEPGPLRDRLSDGLRADLLCVVGGMSKGTHDLVPAALEALGVAWLVTSLRLKPGKPMRLGRAPSGAWVLGLPGNPVSCAVCFLLFARPILQGMQGLGARPPERLSGVLQCDVRPNAARPLFQPAQWNAGPHGESLLAPCPWRGSGDPFGLSNANALLYRPAHAPAAQRGERALFIPLDGLR